MAPSIAGSSGALTFKIAPFPTQELLRIGFRATSLQMETSSEFENKSSDSDFSASLGSQPSGIDLNRGTTSLLEKVFGSSRMAINSPGTMCKRRLGVNSLSESNLNGLCMFLSEESTKTEMA